MALSVYALMTARRKWTLALYLFFSLYFFLEYTVLYAKNYSANFEQYLKKYYRYIPEKTNSPIIAPSEAWFAFKDGNFYPYVHAQGDKLNINEYFLVEDKILRPYWEINKHPLFGFYNLTNKSRCQLIGSFDDSHYGLSRAMTTNTDNPVQVFKCKTVKD